MLSAKLIHFVEAHEEEIDNRILRKIRHDPGLAHLAGLPEGELRERGREILKNLGHWLEFGNEEKSSANTNLSERHGTRSPCRCTSPFGASACSRIR